MRAKLTKELIKNIQPHSTKRISVIDTEVSKLELTVFPTGKKTFNLYYFDSRKGRPVRVKIGNADDITHYRARELAREMLESVSRGTDLIADRNKNKNRLRVKDVIESHAKSLEITDTTPRHRKNIDSILKRHICPQFEDFFIDTITATDIKSFLSDKRRKYSANYTNKIRQALKSLLDHAATVTNCDIPWQEITKFKTSGRQNFLSLEECVMLYDKLKNDNSNAALIILLALFTGVRKTNIFCMKWADISKEGTWNIGGAEVKNRKTQNIYLAPALHKMILGRKIESEFVFPQDNKSKPVNNIDKKRKAIFRKLGRQNFTLHDLKHTFVTLAFRAGVDYHLAATLAGHKIAGATAIYAHAQREHLKKAYHKIFNLVSKVSDRRQKKPRYVNKS